MSYYTKGSLVALCLDLHLRQHGKATLDDVMRGLWSRCKAGPMSEADLLAVLEELTGRSYAAEDCAVVHSTDELPLAALLAAHGVTSSRHCPACAAPGHRVAETTVCRSRPCCAAARAEQAGFAAGDEWLGLRVKTQALHQQARRCGVLRRAPNPTGGRGGARRPFAGTALTLPAAVPPGSVAQGRKPTPPACARHREPDRHRHAAVSRWLAGAA